MTPRLPPPRCAIAATPIDKSPPSWYYASMPTVFFPEQFEQRRRLPVWGRSGIYAITNHPTGAQYIGSAVNLGSRWAVHRHSLRHAKNSCGHLQRAWRKYGESSFYFHVILYCDRQNLLFYEQRAINKFSPRYNIALVVGSQLGLKRTRTARLRMSKPHGPLSEETRKRMSEAHRGKPSPAKGKKWRVESRLRASIAQRQRAPFSEEHRAKISAGLKGRCLSSSSRAKISASLKGREHPPPFVCRNSCKKLSCIAKVQPRKEGRFA